MADGGAQQQGAATAGAAAAWPPDYMAACRLCAKWIVVFPAEGTKRSRYYAAQHCTSMHVAHNSYMCKEWKCQREFKTRKAAVRHAKRKHMGNLDDTVARLVDEDALRQEVDALVERCFPDVPFPRPRIRRDPLPVANLGI